MPDEKKKEKKAFKKGKKKKRPSLGSGFAERAAKAKEGRGRQIDDILAAAEGTLQERDQ